MVSLLSILLFSMSVLTVNAFEGEKGNPKAIPVLMYHTFDENPKFPGINTTGEQFKAQLTYMKENGYTAITTEEFVMYQKGLKKLPLKSFMITIDDGYESVYDIAFPILKELEMKATLFVITSHIELGHRFDIPILTWEQIKEMHNSGYVEIGNHTHDLHWRGNNNTAGYEAMIFNQTKDGRTITNAERERMIISDLKHAHQLIEQNVGEAPKTFAYPYGAYDQVAERAVKSLRYDVVHTVKPGVNFHDGDVAHVKRINMTSEVNPIKLMDQIHQFMNQKSNKANGWLVVYKGGTKIEASVWIEGEQYTKHTDMKEARFELYKRTNGQRIFVRNFGAYRLDPHPVRKTVTMLDGPLAKGDYSLKMIVVRSDKTKEVVWKDFKVETVAATKK